MQLLERLLMEEEGSVLVFSRTKHGASKIARQIRRMGHTADEIHSNRSQNQRQKALKGFDKGKYRVLVATDIAARGIDVSHIKLVINYDLPDQLDDYVHRIGRTGRAGREGKAISFASPEQKRDVAKIQELINVILPIKSPSGEELAPIESQPKKKQGGRRNGRGGGRKRSGGSGSGGGRGRGGKKRAFTSRKNMSNKKRSNRSGGRGRKKSR
jgi:ATP-dependent RNA helicase RhlE